MTETQGFTEKEFIKYIETKRNFQHKIETECGIFAIPILDLLNDMICYTDEQFDKLFNLSEDEIGYIWEFILEGKLVFENEYTIDTAEELYEFIQKDDV